MQSAGRMAVQQDLNRLRPQPLPANFLPRGNQPLTTMLNGMQLLHYCYSFNADSILKSGLRPGSWCTVTALSSYVVDTWLGLPTRRDYVIVLDPGRIPAYQGPGVCDGDPFDPLRRGNAVEFYLPEGAPREAILAHGKLEEF